MTCDRYFALLSARLDGPLAEGEERELEEHLLVCPDCRADGARLAALQGTFAELEELEAPEGFTQGVMDRIRAEEKPKVIPLFKRPQVRALAGLAACLVLVVGIYGISQLRNQEKMMLVTRSFQHDVMWDETIDGVGDVSVQESLRRKGDGPQVNAALTVPEDGEVPQIAAYTAPETQGLDKTAPVSPVDTERTLVPPEADVTLILDRLPDGAAELIPSGVTVSHDVESGADVYTWLTAEELAAIEALAFEQGLLPGTTEGAPAPERCALIVQNR